MQLNITTKRLILKPHTADNLKWLNTLFNSESDHYFNGDDPPKDEPETLEETAQLLERILNRPPNANIIDYAIHRLEDNTLIGCGMIAFINRYNRRCSLGISMGYDQQNWGKGYAREALQAVITYCFHDLDMNRIEAEIYDFNERSVRLFEGLGFCREGAKRQYVYKDGVFKDEYIYSLLRQDWTHLEVKS
jgi:ribosomal-protein-alanine N-acetyltransferase